MLEVRKDDSQATYEVDWEERRIGTIYMEIDGYYVFVFTSNRGGYVESDMLRAIADKLDEMNKEWNDKVQSDPLIGGKPL